MQNIDKLAWIYIKDNRILMVRSKGKSQFYLPGGKRDTGESDQQALIREIKEELQVDLIAPSIQYLFTVSAQADAKPEGVLVVMRCYTAEYCGELAIDSEIEEIAWFKATDNTYFSQAAQLVVNWLVEHNKLSK